MRFDPASATRRFPVFTLMCTFFLAVFLFAGCGEDDSVSPRKTTNRVLQLDGDGDYLSIPFANYAFTTFTIEVKIKVPTYDDNVHYVSLQQNAYIVLGDYGSGAISTWASGLDPIDAGAYGSEGIDSTDEWHHLAFSYDGTNQYILIDGVVVVTAPTTGAVTNDSVNFVQGLKIGARFTGGSQYVEGQIDEVRVWNVFRTEAQIHDNMNKAISSQAGLVGYWNFDSGEAADKSGNDADGVLVGDAVIVKK